MTIIPAIDILNGKCVRLTQGSYTAVKAYDLSPLEAAKAIEDHGIGQVHLVDLDGARSGHIVNYRTLEEIASGTSLRIDFGGGLKTTEAVALAFSCGAAQVTIGSIALNRPGLFLDWLQQYGPEKIILGADCRDRKPAGQGWLQTGTTDIIDYIRDYRRQGLQYTVCTDIARDGMLQGPSLDLYREILDATDICLIASGGIRSTEDLLALRAAGCSGAIIGKALYEGWITLKTLSELC